MTKRRQCAIIKIMKQKKVKLAKDIVNKLLKQGLNHTEIAVEIGVSERTISRWGQGKIKPHRLFVEAMERILKKKIECK